MSKFLDGTGLADLCNNIKTYITNQLASYAPKNSPALTGTPTSTTPTANDNSTKIATTAFVQTAVSGATPTTITDAEIEELWEATVTITQSANQTITVTCKNVAHTTSFTAQLGDTWTATIVADEGYNAGTLSATSGTLTDNITISATSATEIPESKFIGAYAILSGEYEIRRNNTEPAPIIIGDDVTIPTTTVYGYINESATYAYHVYNNASVGVATFVEGTASHAPVTLRSAIVEDSDRETLYVEASIYSSSSFSCYMSIYFIDHISSLGTSAPQRFSSNIEIPNPVYFSSPDPVEFPMDTGGDEIYGDILIFFTSDEVTDAEVAEWLSSQ